MNNGGGGSSGIGNGGGNGTDASLLIPGPDIVLPASAKMRFVYTVEPGYQVREHHRCYDFVFSGITASSADLVPLSSFALEVEGGEIEQRLLRASLLLSNSATLCELRAPWRVERERDRNDRTQRVCLDFGASYLPLAALPLQQYTLRITTNDRLGSRYNVRLHSVNYVSSLVSPLRPLMPHEEWSLCLHCGPAPTVVLRVDPAGRAFSLHFAPLTAWVAWRYGAATIREPVRTQCGDRQQHYQQQRQHRSGQRRHSPLRQLLPLPPQHPPPLQPQPPQHEQVVISYGWDGKWPDPTPVAQSPVPSAQTATTADAPPGCYDPANPSM